LADAEAARQTYGIECHAAPPTHGYVAVVLAVAHQWFRDVDMETLRRWCAEKHVIFDVKSVWPAAEVDGRL
jgi:UDP-N-acetyl-D-galactosamine dehydrogenase